MVLGKFVKNMKKDKIAIIGLGYVVLPLTRLFANIVLTVSHNQFKHLDFDSLKKEITIFYDIKNFFLKI